MNQGRSIRNSKLAVWQFEGATDATESVHSSTQIDVTKVRSHAANASAQNGVRCRPNASNSGRVNTILRPGTSSSKTLCPDQASWSPIQDRVRPVHAERACSSGRMRAMKAECAHSKWNAHSSCRLRRDQADCVQLTPDFCHASLFLSI